ncbi:MAG TPA: hypothetical protein VK957_23580 [Lunatimonas sp.]|nr:hypothetical protein [Lunatimonas sp.]
MRLFFLQLAMNEYTAAAIFAAWCEPKNRYALLPATRGLTVFSTRLLSFPFARVGHTAQSVPSWPGIEYGFANGAGWPVFQVVFFKPFSQFGQNGYRMRFPLGPTFFPVCSLLKMHCSKQKKTTICKVR